MGVSTPRALISRMGVLRLWGERRFQYYWLHQGFRVVVAFSVPRVNPERSESFVTYSRCESIFGMSVPDNQGNELIVD